MQKNKIIVVLVAVLAVLAFLILANCSDGSGSKKSYTGYVAAENLYVLAPVSEDIAVMHAQQGQPVKKDELLFEIDQTVQNARLVQVRANLKELEAKVSHAKAYLAKSTDAINIAQTDVDKTSQDLKRYQEIWDKNSGAVSPLVMDHTRLAASTAMMQLQSFQKEYEAALANVAAAESQLEHVLAEESIVLKDLARLMVKSPVQGRVQEIIVQAGARATANLPVLVLVPHDKTKIRFYVAEKNLAEYPLDTEVWLDFTGNEKPVKGKITYISPRPEFTPPVIYSLETKEKMVFALDATPENPEKFNLGQPVTVQKVQ